MLDTDANYKFFPINGIFGPSKDKGVYVYKDGTIKFHKCCGVSNIKLKLSSCEFNIKDLNYIKHYADYKYGFYGVGYSVLVVNSIVLEDADHKVLAGMPVGMMKKRTAEELIKYLKSLKSDIKFDEAVEQLYTEGSWSLMYKRLFKAYIKSMWPWLIVFFLIMILNTSA